MKKIFAIALALVMVLSMASAFALNNCSGNFAWGCPADVNYCGKGAIEVVPYVKVNNACGGYDWQVSECASAVNTEKVYYAVKLTVDANPDDNWWDAAAATLSYDGLDASAPALANNIADIPEYLAAKEIDDEENTFYFNFVTKYFDLVDDDFELGGAHVKEEVVKKAADAKVCAKLTSYDDGFGTWTFGDYTVTVTTTGITVTDGTDSVWMNYVLGKKITAVSTTKDSFFAQVVADLNLGSCAVGTCVTEENIEANFGWDDEVKDCFEWSDKAASIVDAECVVAIPKTGDASVLAWLF